MASKLKIEKRGDEIKKKSSPLKLLSQSQPNFAEMILVWSPFKIVSVSAVSSNLGTFWLKIEQFWPFEEISIFSNGGHLGDRTALTDTILKGDEMILRWSPFKIVSVSAVLYPRWPPLLKIEISSNGQNCSILSQ
jgi:hypothetical protein